MSTEHATSRDAHTTGEVASLDQAVAVFVGVRPRLQSIAYRIIGCWAEAEDIVQDAWVRWQTCERDNVRDATAFLVTMTTRLALTSATSSALPTRVVHRPLVDRAGRCQSRSGVASRTERSTRTRGPADVRTSVTDGTCGVRAPPRIRLSVRDDCQHARSQWGQRTPDRQPGRQPPGVGSLPPGKYHGPGAPRESVRGGRRTRRCPNSSTCWLRSRGPTAG